MRPQVITLTGVSTSAWIPLEVNKNPFSVGMGAKIESGTATYSVEHTFDDVFSSTATLVAFPNATLSGQTTNKDGNYAFPVRGVRLQITAGTGTVSLTVLQSG